MSESRDLHDYDPNYICAWLYNAKCRVTFTKRDGQKRVMICTLKKEYLPEHTNLEEHEHDHTGRVVVWDLEKEDWRAIRFDSILQFDYFSPMSEDFLP